MTCLVPKNNLIEIEDNSHFAELLYVAICPFISKPFDPFNEAEKIRTLFKKVRKSTKMTHCARRMFLGVPLFAVIWDLPDIEVGKTAYIDAYVYNPVIPEYSEFGTVVIERLEDGFHYIG